MCGFAGYYKKAGITDENKLSAREMSYSIRHRGPDLDRVYECEKLIFAFRRLSIIDLEGGGQPFISDDGRFICVYNGEIYNYLELKSELEKKGHCFKTNSEVEVMVTLYSLYGAGFISRLRGMFAFVIYDKENDFLMAGRDPFGIKPLYYRKDSDGIVFCSEMKGYFFDKNYKGFDVDKALLQHYLTFQYVSEPDTISGDIFILPKGSYMLYYGKKDGKTDILTYYKPVFSQNKTSTYLQKKANLRKAVESSVEYHMLADVPVGSFLSSGVDSAIITAIASKISPGIKAFTIGFDVKGYSELEDAAAISSHLDIDHIKLQCTLKDFTDNYERVIYHLDSPMADPSVVAIYLISREAAKHVKVILSGEGSDELFGGYRQYASAIPAAKIYSLPSFIKSFLMILARLLPEHVKGKGLITRGCVPIEQRFVGNAFVFSENEKRGILRTYDSNVHFTQRTKDIYTQVGDYTMIQKMQHCDLNTWLPSDILVKGDRLSMAHSLEARVPYLDKEVFKAARELCDSDKISKDTTKYILRDAFADILNKETVMRPKLGYPVPVRTWLKDELYDWAAEIIKESTADEYIDSGEALKLLERHRNGKYDYYKHIWVILTFITWYKLYVTDAKTTKNRILNGEL
ncbi:MAG TPA: asparagine synthase (glutamine-hydrolyzing) [Clostridiales bacterium]|nr:asparagine synthase (glutamine-hydrolyzing) [Clostridiales bacterium]